MPLPRTSEQLRTSASWCTQKDRRKSWMLKKKNGTKYPDLSFLVSPQICALLCCYRSPGPANPRERIDFFLVSSSFLSSAEHRICCGSSWVRLQPHLLDKAPWVTDCTLWLHPPWWPKWDQNTVPWLYMPPTWCWGTTEQHGPASAFSTGGLDETLCHSLEEFFWTIWRERYYMQLDTTVMGTQE